MTKDSFPVQDLCCAPVTGGRLDEAAAEELAAVLKALADPVRLRLISIVAVPTPEASGMLLSAILGVSVDLTAIHDVAETIRTYPEVRYVGMSAGRYDLMVEAFFTDQEHLLEFITGKLGTLPGISSLETSIILKVVKFSYEWEIA